MAFPESLMGTLEDVKECSSTRKHPIGTRLVLPDGRVFHYAKNSTVILAVGKLVCSPAVDADENVDLVPSAAVTTADTEATIVGTMSTAAATVAANRFDSGYMYVNTGTGAGQVVHLATTGNDAGGSSTGATVAVYFDDGEYLSVAIDTSSSKVGLVQNPYRDVVICPQYATYSVTSRPAGIPISTITASEYFWLQTWGPCPVMMGAAPIEGELIMQGGTSTGAAGEATVRGVSTSATGEGVKLDLPSIGVVMSGDADAEYALVYLMIAP